MPLPALKTTKYMLAVCLLLCFKPANAQVNYDKLTNRIDSLANVGLPKSALMLVDQLDDIAHKNNNSPQQIRAVIYRMTFQSYLEENALTAIIMRLKADIDKAEYPVKPVLQSLLAQIYWNYYQQNRYQFGKRTTLDKPGADFTNWDLRTITNETSRLYEVSLQNAEKEQSTPAGILDGVLDGDKSTRYLRPTLYDLLVQRAFDFFLTDEAGLTKPKMPFTLNDPRFFSDSPTFAALEVKTTDTASVYYKGIKYLQQATTFHLKGKDEEALADLDLQRLKFLYDKANPSHKDSLYLAALKQIAISFSTKPISADALVLQGQFYQNLDSLVIAHDFFKNAFEKFPESLGGKNAATLIRQIEAKELWATVEDVNMPGKPLLALLNYRNIKAAEVSIYHLLQAQVKQLTDKNAWYEGYNIKPTDKTLKFLKNLIPVQKQQSPLPDPKDYRKHSAEFKINALEQGSYVILVKDANSSKGNLIQVTSFIITHLAYTARVDPDKQTELRIIDRETGAPLPGVSINIYKGILKTEKMVKTLINSGTSDINGKYFFTSTEEQYAVNLSKGSDTYIDNEKYFSGVAEISNNNVPAQTTAILFSDRQIYRPGQTIYFKGLLISTMDGKSTIVPQTSVTINFNDINYKIINSVRLMTNEFGTLQGSFIIPQTISNGVVTLNTVYGSTYVRVEEYKRPTFQVTFQPVTQTYKINDSIKLKGKVIAFAGYGLSGAKVALHITRQAKQYFNFLNRYKRTGLPESAEIRTDTINTDDQGEFQVNLKAVPDDKDLINNAYDYSVNTDVTDASGETQSANTKIIVSDSPLKLVTDIPQKLLPTDTAVIPLRLTNLYDRSQKGTIDVKIFPLKGTPGIFKSRLWDNPDQSIFTKNEFKNAFPGYEWQNEEDYNKWETTEKINELSINANDTSLSNLDLGMLKKQASGIYKVVLNARNVKGDTASITQFVAVVADPAQAQKIEDWVLPITTQVKKGGQATFLVGINRNSHVLLEKYQGAKLLSSEWLTLTGDYQRQIKIPVPITAKNDFNVQFMMVYDNRLYHYYAQIKMVDTVKKLNIRFITFRDKLQPGQKERWKLQVTAADHEKIQVEMLADLYDASLDDITPSQEWQTSFGYNAYKPNYFEWMSDELAKRDVTGAYADQNQYEQLIDRNYESLNLFGYGYYGGNNYAYNSYLDQVAAYKRAIKNDKKIATDYFKNAALVKNGYDVTGRVIAGESNNGLPGVKIRIKNTSINTLSNSSGYFKVKVPINGALIFSYEGYGSKQITPKAGENLNVKLIQNGAIVRELAIADPGQKNLKGEKNADVAINEPVGSSVAKFASPIVMHEIRIKGLNRKGYLTDDLSRNSNHDAESPAIPLRANFNETAFFYPQLRTDEKGEILIDFTIPEALTRWKFRGFAHTQDLQTGYIENMVVTQKQLSISANTPRFLREGDTITISARLANLTSGILKGKVQMQLFNALNMQPIGLFVNNAAAGQIFEIAGGTTKAISFRLYIPAGLDALTYRLTADAGQFTDGEENTLPVLPNRTLVTESMPMMVRAGQTRNFTFEKLVNQSSNTLQNKTLTLEYTQNPAWYAVQALPYLMEFPYECSEQVFSRYYANSLATSIVGKLPAIKQVFDQWKNGNSDELLSNLEKNQELKQTLIEETPWLKDAENETEQKKRIAILFDVNKMSDELKLNLDKLQKKQLASGGFTWFAGNIADRYITQHILEGIGELYHLGIATDQPELKQVADNALAYLDNQLITDAKIHKNDKGYATRPLNDVEIHAWFTQSYFLNKTLSSEMQTLLNDYINRSKDQWTMRNTYEQGMIALTMQRYKRQEVTAQIERSLLETAQQSDDLGMYWAKNQRGYFWYESPVETQSLLIELFTEAGNNDKAVDEMKIWLLRNKQTNNWKTTKATAAACYALLLKGSNLLADNGKSAIKMDGKLLEQLKPDVKTDAGTGYIKTTWIDEQVKPDLGKVEIKNNGTNISWGALHWQYLENLDKITSSSTNIQLQRKYFIQKQTDAGPVLTAVDAAHQPKTGDLLKVVVYLKADRDFEYVQLQDLRPAGTEPVDALSEYKYKDGLYYYQVTKDVATNFFISYLNKGNFVFEYQLRVAQPGNFSTGITTVQCVYAPEFNAHSSGGRMVIK